MDRLWAEIFRVHGDGDYMRWERVSADVVPINISCIQDTPCTVFQVTAYNKHVEKIFDVKITQPGNRVLSLCIKVRFQSFLPLYKLDFRVLSLFVSQSGIRVLSPFVSQSGIKSSLSLFYSQVTEFSPLSFKDSHQNFQISQLKDCFSHQILKRKVCMKFDQS